ncbi:class I SAM-dependent methyltransferase [Nocardiopsis valliformis]|uniref:class I SAM-dependent methyltransferase n=1 Tax=Nocardiopsis valliformis TaxID=239974 RepID=UPI0004760916|nr:class I SAM-dependent methyltransferase [Nocardiopsis valliformis]
MSEDFDKDYWEKRYGGQGEQGGHAGHTGHTSHGGHGGQGARTSPQLVAEASDLEPGTALDAGCGEGGDSLWLASRGWRVRAVDLSETALGRGRERAAARGPELADRITWEQADLTVWTPPENTFDLVTSQYVHTTGSLRDLLARLAASVAPGGTLLFVGHHPGDEQSTHDRGHDAHVHFTAPELAADLDRADWEVLVAEDRSHRVTRPDGREVTMHDAVIRARRVR